MLGKHNETDIRRRRGNKDEADQVEPLDEDDQAKMIEQLRAEAARQQESILQIFQYLCVVAAVVLTLSTIYMDQWHLKSVVQKDEDVNAVRPFSMAHGATSAVLHLVTPTLSRPATQSQGNSNGRNTFLRLSLAVDVLAATSMLWMARRYGGGGARHDETLLWMHYGILASNLLVMSAAVLLRWDGESTDKAFKDLTKAQYSYKSL